ncbi:alpha/beta fold hydrolase [Mycobacterium sp. shizuoka-1]|uniref:alpha/beta fold hydrolase n=1 Tax=Mycobacterium sp. shizuoka-1 TaxID=2039281 RepID=UPI000C0645BD|nr:alpha/beta fold hydrolase [Mycobacterium sp. shizuoka-1]GAY17451.1 hypothetical protein MSZK_41770 [Mycobacterium sp. shizuoka-1]
MSTDPCSPVPPQRPIEHRSVAAHFEWTAGRHPDRIALRTAAQAVSYGELFASACAVRTDTPPDGPTPRAALIPATLTPATVSAILGLIASRTVVVALDPELGNHRTMTIATILAQHGYDVTTVTGPSTSETAPPGASTLGAAADTADVTSIQFTSGSTGTPKTVLHTNGLWLADAQLLNDRFGLADARTVALCMPISFAGGLNILIGSLLGGAEIIAVDPREHSARAAFERIDHSRAQVITCTPSFVDALHRVAGGDRLPHVERIVTTGEPLQARHVQLLRGLAPGAVVTNWVGSTETLAIASYDIGPTDAVPRGVIPVGIPAPHKRIDISPDGIVSITSAYLGSGYLDKAASSAMFLDNGDGTTTYVGGDVGRWDEHGNLVLAGRSDNTVKIRGYLVSPAEIEATLASYDDIREVAVVAGDDEPPSLTAYVAPSATDRTPSVAELRGRLHRDLPPWMVPAGIEMLATLPRNERGKVDRTALPRPSRIPFEPPRGVHETATARLWAEVLRIERVGRADSFYALGGDSLSVAQMLVALRESHGVVLGPNDLAGAPTLAAFARTLAGAQRVTPKRPGRDLLRPTTTALRPLSAQTAAAPLFCFTGAGASALCFLPLAERVGNQTAVYAFEPNGLATRALPDWSIRRAVQRHWSDLRRLQPHGPYTLVGHSLGAHIALETAHTLEAHGETVSMVVLLDPWLSPRVAWAARNELPDATVTLQTDDANGFGTWWERQKTVPLAGLFSADYNRRTRAVEEAGMIAAYRHRPRPWAGSALLIRSHLNADDPRLWRRVLTGQLQTEVLDCDHHSIVRAPHIAAVVDLMRAAREARC